MRHVETRMSDRFRSFFGFDILGRKHPILLRSVCASTPECEKKSSRLFDLILYWSLSLVRAPEGKMGASSPVCTDAWNIHANTS